MAAVVMKSLFVLYENRAPVSSIAVRPSSPQRRWRKVFGAEAAARSAAQGPGEHPLRRRIAEGQGRSRRRWSLNGKAP